METAPEPRAEDVQAARALRAGEPCPNCGDATPGKYCPQCGQRRIRRLLSMRAVAAVAIDDQFSLNSKLPRTLMTLLLRPGVLTTEFIAGRIARYLPPFRLYLIASFVYFLVSAAVGGEERGVNFTRTENGETVEAPPSKEQAAEVIDRLFARVNVPFEEWLQPRMRARILELEGGLDEFGRRMDAKLAETMPIVIIMLVPFFAAVLKLLYIRQRRYYVEHFVVALHVHAFSFILLAVLGLLSAATEAFAFAIYTYAFNFVALALLGVLSTIGDAFGIIALALPVYVLLAMRRVYAQRWLITALKLLTVSAVYGLVMLAVTIMLVLGIFLYGS